ncbi:MAG: radical SAM protein [Candidatus Woesearchaeota archaeon]
MQQIKRKSLLYKSQVEYADFCINHVEGCSHGCTFPCYAFLMAKRFGKAKNYSEWIQPKLVSNALDLLDREIPKYRQEIKSVHLCFTTDPFMYRQKEVEQMTLKIIEKLHKDRIVCTVLTKGVYPQILANKNIFGDNKYGITLVSLDDGFKKRFERYAAPYDTRIESLRMLHKKGLSTWVSMEPYPTPNIVTQNLKKVLNKISFVDRIVFGKLNYNVTTSLFGENKTFYNDCADQVVDFCKDNGIEWHIKYGTATEELRPKLVVPAIQKAADLRPFLRTQPV